MSKENLKNCAYPTTIKGVLAYGIDKWLDEGHPNIFCGAYRRIYSIVFNAYKKAFECFDSAPHCYYCSVINYKTVSYFSHIIYERHCFELLKQRGYTKILRGSDTELLSNATSKSSNLNFDKISFSLSPTELLLEKLRAVKLNRGDSSVFYSCFPQSSRKGVFIIGDKNQKEISEYLSEIESRPIVLKPRLYENPSVNLNESDIFKRERENLRSRVEQFFKALRNELPEHSQFFSAGIEKDFFEFYLASLESLFSTIRRIEKWKHARKLLVTHIGNIHHRIFASAWKMLDRETIGFSHGNIYPYAYAPGDILNGAMDILNKFVVVSKGEKKLLEDALRDFKPASNNEIKFIALKNSAYKQIFEKAQTQDRQVHKISTIMFVGHPMDNFNSPYLDFMNTLSLFDLELRLLKDLKSFGFKIIYKAHPDTLSSTAGIYDKLVDTVEGGRFENNYKEADCILFTKPFSTTFGYALMTKKPVVLLKHQQFGWHKDILPLLEKRVSLLDASLNENGRILYDIKQLKNAIEQSLSRLDYEIVHKYAF